MSSKSKNQLRTENSNNFPNNNSQFITPELLRTFNADIIDSVLVNIDSGSFVTTSSFDNSTRIQTFTKGDGSTYTNTIPGGGGASDSGSFLETASFDNGSRNMTFTKVDASTFSLNIPSASASNTLQEVTDNGNVTTDTIQAPTFFTTTDTGIDSLSLSIESAPSEKAFIYVDGNKVIEFDSGSSRTDINAYDVKVSQSLHVQGALTASLTEGNLWVGNSSNDNTEIPSSSFVSSNVAIANVLVTPQTVTDDVTILTNNNALVAGDTSFAGTFTIEGTSQLTVI